MTFDPCPHHIRNLVIKAAKLRRKELGMDIENNITVLYNEMAPLLGIPVVQMNSKTIDHLPSPAEMKNKDGKLLLPAKDCPKCGEKQSVFPMSVCTSCEDWKNGYRSSWSCIKKGCGYKELLKTPYAALLDEVAPGWGSGFKKYVQTNEGIK
jgi:hypothetical protein